MCRGRLDALQRCLMRPAPPSQPKIRDGAVVSQDFWLQHGELSATVAPLCTMPYLVILKNNSGVCSEMQYVTACMWLSARLRRVSHGTVWQLSISGSTALGWMMPYAGRLTDKTSVCFPRSLTASQTNRSSISGSQTFVLHSFPSPSAERAVDRLTFFSDPPTTSKSLLHAHRGQSTQLPVSCPPDSYPPSDTHLGLSSCKSALTPRPVQ